MPNNLRTFFFFLLTCKNVYVASAQSSAITAIKNSNTTVFLQDGSVAGNIKVSRQWDGDFCTTTLTNTTGKDVRIKEVVLMQANHLFDSSTSFYAEGFQMLSQYRGTLASPTLIGSYDDNGHYKLPQPAGYKAVY